MGLLDRINLLYADQFLLPLFYRDLLGADALTAALMMLPRGVGALLSCTLAGRETDAHGGRVVAACRFVAIALTTVPFMALDPHAPSLLLGSILFARGLAVGMLIVSITTCSYTSVPDGAISDTAAIVRMFQQVGDSFGQQSWLRRYRRRQRAPMRLWRSMVFASLFSSSLSWRTRGR